MTQASGLRSESSCEQAAITVADRVNELFRLLRENKVQPPADRDYDEAHQPAGFALLADELEIAPRVRLLLGAEPG